jgi:splicing factor 1
MEAETGCKISIRGKGSVKEGAKARGVKSFDDDDELHVYVQGETEDQVEKAAKIVKDLLTPVDDDKNEHKQKQLRELALINGTLRDDEYCHVCGEKGHRQYECPHR